MTNMFVRFPIVIYSKLSIFGTFRFGELLSVPITRDCGGDTVHKTRRKYKESVPKHDQYVCSVPCPNESKSSILTISGFSELFSVSIPRQNGSHTVHKIKIKKNNNEDSMPKTGPICSFGSLSYLILSSLYWRFLGLATYFQDQSFAKLKALLYMRIRLAGILFEPLEGI